MSMDKSLLDLNVKIGTKQTMKLVESDRAIEVYVALDAEDKYVSSITNLCKRKGIKLTTVNTMHELGKACGIDVGAAMVAIVSKEL